MDVRPATPEDGEAIIDVAERSFQSSYSFSPDQIATLVEHDFTAEAIAARLDSGVLIFVVEAGPGDVGEDETGGARDGDRAADSGGGDAGGNDGEADRSTLGGFAEVELGERGILRWLHVHPDVRGTGIGTALFERVQSAVAERGLGPMYAEVLTEAAEGGEFLERFGLVPRGNAHYEFDGETFSVEVYAPSDRR